MYTLKVNEYGDLIRKCYNVKSPFYVYGGPGIGKSEMPRQVFPEIAKEMDREYLEWSDISIEKKHECIANPGDYFIFCDQRVGQMDSTDLRGIPNLINSEMLETIPMSWVIYFTQVKAAGAIFFDELNLAAPVVAGQAYQIINERTIADRRLAPDVFVFGEGNRPGIDEAFCQPMPFPLRDRFNEFEVEPDIKSWSHWAAGKVNPHLVAFVSWKPSYLYKVNNKKANKSSTPRGIVRASLLIGKDDATSNMSHQMLSIAVGEAFATEFQAYVKCYSQLNWDTIFKNPKCVEDMTVDKHWAIVGGLADRYLQIDKVDKAAHALFDNVMTVLKHLPADFSIVGTKMIKDSGDIKKFKSLISKYKGLDDMVDDLGKFVL